MDLAELQRCLDVFAALDPGRLPLHHAQVFLFIARQGSCTYRDIEQAFSLSNASASRIVNSLSAASPHRKNCLDLVEAMQDPAEGRRLMVRLTIKGKAVARQLAGI